MKSVVKTVLYCVMGVYLLTGAAMLAFDAVSASVAPSVMINAAVEPSETQPASESGYVVKSAGGKVAVEDVSTGKIVRTTDTRVASLPKKDRSELERGIVVKNKSELRSVLEDLCS